MDFISNLLQLFFDFVVFSFSYIFSIFTFENLEKVYWFCRKYHLFGVIAVILYYYYVLKPMREEKNKKESEKNKNDS